jgi:hypothetical protein
MKKLTIEEEKYKRLVEYLRTTQSKRTIRNGSKEMVLIALENLIDIAEKEINIYSGKFNLNIWGDDRVKNKLSKKKDIDIKILLEELPEQTEKELSQCYPNIQFRKIKEKFGIGHFLTVDKSSFRLEKANNTPNNEEISAIFSFNRRDINRYLRKKFHKKFACSQ